MKVKNINNTGGRTCPCGAWLTHWENFSGQAVPEFCPTLFCTNTPEDGAHVQLDSATDRRWYIVPLCKTCNNKKGQALEIDDDIELVSANVAQTCG